jgi:hypothetical protein
MSDCGLTGKTIDRRAEKIIVKWYNNRVAIRKGTRVKNGIFRAYVNNMSKGENIS